MTGFDDLRAHEAAQANGNGAEGADGTHIFPCTDYGNAERLVARDGRDLRYCQGIGWLVWDGRRWRHDDSGEVMRRAKAMSRAILAEALGSNNEDERKRIAQWAFKSETEPRLRAAITLAESEEPIVVRTDELDANPWLLTALNGTVDLKSGKLHHHRREDLITKLAPVSYDPDAPSLRWEMLLTRVTGGDADLATFLQRLAGYTACGVTDEEILCFVHGPGSTGKTTFVETLKSVLGDYSATSDFESFLERRGDGGIRNDIARLAGTRMVCSTEVQDGKRLAEGLIKQLTGGDKVAARFLHKEFFEFQPRFTLWLVANDRPKARASDDALWRRIVSVPFVVVVPQAERDPELKRQLRSNSEDQSAVLAWLVSGALAWQTRGLDIPDVVRAATAEYRAENDYLSDFIGDECRLGPDLTAFAGELRRAYEGWCERNGEKPIAERTWGAQLKDHGCVKDRQTDGQRLRIWHGIALGDAV